LPSFELTRLHGNETCSPTHLLYLNSAGKQGQVFISQLNVGLLGMMFGGTIADVMGMAGK